MIHWKFLIGFNVEKAGLYEGTKVKPWNLSQVPSTIAKSVPPQQRLSSKCEIIKLISRWEISFAIQRLLFQYCAD